MEDQELKNIFQTIRELPPEVDLSGIEQFVLAQPIAIYTYSGPVDGSSWLTFKNLIVMISTVSAVGIGMGVLLLGGGSSSSTVKAPREHNPQQTVAAWEDSVPGPGKPPADKGAPMPPEPLLSAPTVLSSHPFVPNDTAPPLNEILIGPGSAALQVIPPPAKPQGGECDDDEHVVSVFAKEMEKDGLIRGDKYSFSLNDKGLVVNGKKQPAAVFAKYRELYEKQTGRRVTASMEISVSVAPGNCSVSKSNTGRSASPASSSTENGRTDSGLQTSAQKKEEFTEIILESGANIKVVKGAASEFRIEITGGESVPDGLQSRVQGGSLYIRGNPGRAEQGNPHMTVVMPEDRLNKIHILGSGSVVVDAHLTGLNLLEILGSGNIVTRQGMESPDLTVNILGRGNIVLNGVEAKKLKVNLPGSGSLKALGRADELSINIQGSGAVYMDRLDVRTADCHIQGSGKIILGHTSDTLTTVISGSGNVQYSGNPLITKQITGTGTVSKKPAK